VGVEFDLTGTVDDEVVVLVRAQLVVQPVEVVEQVPERKFRGKTTRSRSQHAKPSVRLLCRHSLEAVHQPSVRPKLHLLHDILQTDEVLDVDRWRVLELCRGRVEVEEVDLAVEGLGMGDDGRAEGRLAGPCWACRRERRRGAVEDT
jgi:hypothetical protein